jgi:CDP-diacylglycerol--glycerol-3-phosphate 3-phosphatidyltransferase
MVQLELFPAWMVVLILAREFLITGLRQLAIAEGRVLSADRWGKNKTIAQLTTIITALVYLAARDWLNVFGLWERVIVRSWDIERYFQWGLHFMIFFCVVLTIVSGIRYYIGNMDIIKAE